MKKGILIIKLAKIIVGVICAVFSGIFIFRAVDKINEEISGKNRETYIQILDRKAKRIEDTGLTLEELTDEQVYSHLSKSEIAGYYVFEFSKGMYKVSIYFDGEENIVSIQKEYPEGYNLVHIIIPIILPVLYSMITFILIKGTIRDIKKLLKTGKLICKI